MLRLYNWNPFEEITWVEMSRTRRGPPVPGTVSVDTGIQNRSTVSVSSTG